MMASSPTIQACLAITRHNNYDCVSKFPIHNGIESEIDSKRSNFRFNRGHALLRRQISKSIVFHPQRTLKRRFTFPGNQDKSICKKRRRFTSVALPTKFLLGGNINDPLNLRSLDDEKVNQQLNAFTPASSPMPMSRHRTQVQVLIPPNIYDPLNLNTGEEIEFNLLTTKPRKRRRHRKNRKEDADEVSINQMLPLKQEDCDSPVHADNSLAGQSDDDCPDSEFTFDTSTSSEERITSDKIVSPVVPQGLPAKFKKRYHSRSFSKDVEEKPCHKQIKRRHSKIRLQRKADYVTFRANAEKFYYGNHVVRQMKLDDFSDQRLQIFNKDLFWMKDIIDIGCNTGELTLYIANHWKPNKIIGIDIDKKLINIAQRKIREFKSKRISGEIVFPKSMYASYGQLTKIGVSMNSSWKFPSNILFFEANYVPGSEECLETQKPEYDVILCLRVTKWIHLNFGDDGLKLAFKRMFAQLRIGGCLILEPQPWFTYSMSKRITPSIYKTYCSLQMRPEMFCKFLMSEEVGFSTCELLGRTYNCTKVYRQPIYLLTKGFQTSCRRNIQMEIPFHSPQWSHMSDEQGTCSTFSDPE